MHRSRASWSRSAEPASCILEQARAHNAGLIIVGRASHLARSRPSTAAKVLRRARAGTGEAARVSPTRGLIAEARCHRARQRLSIFRASLIALGSDKVVVSIRLVPPKPIASVTATEPGLAGCPRAR